MAHMNESCRIRQEAPIYLWESLDAFHELRARGAVTHPYVCRDLFICVPWLIHTCARIHSYVCNDSLISVWSIHFHSCGKSQMPSTNFARELTWLICTCAVTHPYVCRDSFICVPWPIHTFAITHVYLCDLSTFIHVENLDASSHSLTLALRSNFEFAGCHIRVCNNLVICVPWLIIFRHQAWP